MDYTVNPLDSSLTKRKLNFASRPQESMPMPYSQPLQPIEPRKTMPPQQYTSFMKETREMSPTPIQTRQPQGFKPSFLNPKKQLRSNYFRAMGIIFRNVSS